MLRKAKARDYEDLLRERIARKYGIDEPERIDLDRAQEYELRAERSPERELELFLDKLEQQRARWRG